MADLTLRHAKGSRTIYVKEPATHNPSMKPSEVLQLHRETIRNVVARYDACNPRIFGSVRRGDDIEGSDIDLLIDPIIGKTSLLSLARIKRDLEKSLGVRIDVQTPNSIHELFRDAVLREAVAV